MAELAALSTLAAMAVPLLLAGMLSLRRSADHLRGWSVGAAGLILLLASVAWAVAPADLPIAWPARDPVWRIDGLSASLLPFAGLIWGATLLALPRASLDRRRLRRSALGTFVLLVAFSSEHPLLLAASWVLGIAVYLVELAPSRPARRVAGLYLGVSALTFVAGTVVIFFAPPGAAATWVGASLVLVAAMIRKAIVPFHSWLPAVWESAPLAPSLLFSMPQVGAYVSVVVLLRHAPAPLLAALTVLALLTSVYGAMVATVQRDLRRAFAWFFVSQSALVMVGLESASSVGLAGGLSIWYSSGIALTGLGLAIGVLEARRGRLALDRLHGGYERMPMLAVAFLLMGLASIGFPGTLGFVGEELLLDGAVERFPLLGFAVVLATALNGVAMLRMYFSLFTGRRDAGLVTTLLPRERVVFGVLTASMLIGGLALPHVFTASREAVAERLLAARQAAAR